MSLKYFHEFYSKAVGWNSWISFSFNYFFVNILRLRFKFFLEGHFSKTAYRIFNLKLFSPFKLIKWRIFATKILKSWAKFEIPTALRLKKLFFFSSNRAFLKMAIGGVLLFTLEPLFLLISNHLNGDFAPVQYGLGIASFLTLIFSPIILKERQ